MTSSNPRCVACKELNRTCHPECVLAPYIQESQLDEFKIMPKVFTEGVVSKLVKKLSPKERQDAVMSLKFEAQCRIDDPVFGCAGIESKLNQQGYDISNFVSSGGQDQPLPTLPMQQQPQPQHQPPPIQEQQPPQQEHQPQYISFEQLRQELEILKQQVALLEEQQKVRMKKMFQPPGPQQQPQQQF